jgi:MscS family membrane protein
MDIRANANIHPSNMCAWVTPCSICTRSAGTLGVCLPSIRRRFTSGETNTSHVAKTIHQPFFPVLAARTIPNALSSARPVTTTMIAKVKQHVMGDIFQNLKRNTVNFAQFCVSQHIRPGDVVVALVCVLFQARILRAIFAMYKLLAGFLDPQEKRIPAPTNYETSVVAAAEHAGILQLGGTISLLTMAIKTFFAAGKCVGISDPIKGGTHLRFRNSVTAIFVGLVLSRIKRNILRRENFTIGVLKSPRQIFVVDRVTDVFLFLSSVLACVESAGLPLQSLITFGGVGGLAIGLAGKEVIGNLFGGVALLFTSPFAPGEYIESPHASGRVSAVGFYTTRFVDPEGRSALVPNSLFTNASVTNLSRATRRRFITSYQLRYEDLHVVAKIVDLVNTALSAMPIVDKSDFVRSHMTNFGPYSVKCEASCMFLTNDRDRYLQSQQEALLRISTIVHETGAEFATLRMLDPRVLTEGE